MAAKKSTATHVEPAQIGRPAINPEVVAAVARWVAARRRQDAAFYATDKHPNSYGSGCRDGAAIAERVLFEVAQGFGAVNTRLMDHLFRDKGHAKRKELDRYRHGLVVGYLSAIHEWAVAAVRSGSVS